MSKLMRVFLSAALATALLTSIAVGQIAYRPGDQVVSAGLGLGALAGVYGDLKMPPISVGFDMGYNENISFGGLAGIASSEAKYTWFTGSWGWEYTYIIIGARGAYHLDVFKNPNIDSYVGLMLGYNIVSVKEVGTIQSGYSAGDSYLVYGGYLGLRYYFSPQLGVQAELGYGLGVLNIGIAYKL